MNDPMNRCRICDAAHDEPLDGVSREESDVHEREHCPPSTAHYLFSTGRVVRLNGGNRWVEREPFGPAARIEPSGHLTTCDPDQYDSECPRCREQLCCGTDDLNWLDRLDALPVYTVGTESIHGPTGPVTWEEMLDEIDGPESITDEAYRLVMGPRQSDYNHPADDFKATGRQWGAILTNWLHSEGYTLSLGSTQQYGPVDVPDIPPRIVALMMAQLKLSRESHKTKRDNRVDAVGYILCSDRIVEGY